MPPPAAHRARPAARAKAAPRSLVAGVLVLAGVPIARAADESPAAARPDVGRSIDLAAERLRARLAASLAHPDLAGAKVGVVVKDTATGAVLFERGADLPLAPASNMKLVTAGALIELLGPERKLSTRLLADHAPDKAGGIGRLYIVGAGDPSLSVENLYGIARALAAQGVRHVAGVVADDTYFAGACRPGSWSARNCATWYGAPCSALGVAGNLVAVHARAGGASAPIVTWADPFPSFFRIDSQLKVGPGSWRIQSQLAIDDAGDTTQVLAISGRVRAGKAQRVLVPVEDPPLYCAHGLAESLRRVGVVVDGEPVRGQAPAKAALLHSHLSRPLSVLVEDMNKDSSNVYAETFLKLLGAEIAGAPGTREKGLEVLKAWLEHVSPGGCACRLEDGSGLSPLGRLTSRMVADVLLLMTGDSFAAPEFLVTLPIGGVDGTLRKRFSASAARRLVRAKTGRINQVTALSGVARIGAGRDAVFSILVNDYRCPAWKAEDAVDRVVEALVGEAPRVAEPRVRVEEIAVTEFETEVVEEIDPSLILLPEIDDAASSGGAPDESK